MIEFRKITMDNCDECMNLELKEEQEDFVAPNIYSLAEAYAALTNEDFLPIPFAIYSDGTMVGFIEMSYMEADETNDENYYDLDRFMIDKKYQGKGYGKEALKKAIDFIKTFPYGKASVLQTFYEPENKVAKRLYESFGFEETVEIVNGEIKAKLCL